ncbi:hypothetical protein SAMN05216556_1374 [Aequorivita viscosa]|uniref:Uncharacterized protein n=1 Tax=Aequorivita viscosa TaxID=797419 RepID=A0A1M6NXQ0_9FLAO|nr:hypothetical protein SAMN05216556_1374 [Aequorivita viscosa]SHK00421.1 hypothetical protein SAMN04487908_1404 [Aequorivita viscosa]
MFVFIAISFCFRWSPESPKEKGDLVKGFYFFDFDLPCRQAGFDFDFNFKVLYLQNLEDLAG